MVSRVFFKQACKSKLTIRILCVCVLLIFLSLLTHRHMKTLQSTRQTSQKVALYLNKSKDTVQPYLKILPRKNTKENAESPIPRILHQTWKSPNLSVVFKPWIKSCIEQNPDWEYWFWTDKEMRDMIADKYPEFLQMYDGYPKSIYRADAFRIFVVHQHGGVYADLDFECLQPLWKAIGKQRCFFSTESEAHAQFFTKVEGPLVSNGLFGCVVNHPFFIYIIQNMKNHSNKGVLHATGPFLISKLHKQFSSNEYQLTSGEGNDVPLSEPEIFQPTIDENKVNDLKKSCKNDRRANATERGRRVCENIVRKDFRNQPTHRSVTNHHWSHTWAGPRWDHWGIQSNKHYFNITELNNMRND